MDILLDFKGPFLLKDLVNENSAYYPGIYIWGFKDSGQSEFIPYYVGKSLNNIVGRIAQHKKDILKENSTYTRLSDSFMNSFYLHDQLEKLIKSTKQVTKKPDWFEDFPTNSIEYINARWFIQLKTNKDQANLPNYPISLIKPKNDFLLKNINGLLICYAIHLENGLVSKQQNDFYENLESITKIGLRGKTFGKKEKSVITNKFSFNSHEYAVNIKNMNDKSDRLNYIFKDEFNESYLGY